jgi:hypothetical protein
MVSMKNKSNTKRLTACSTRTRIITSFIATFSLCLIFLIQQDRKVAKNIESSPFAIVQLRRSAYSSPDEDTPSRRPIMHTFYQKVNQGEDELISVWSDEWNRAGFDTKVVTLDDAKKHPYFSTMEQVVKPIFGGEDYNAFCLYRWLAMAQVGGGWMSDYDTFPTNFPIEEGFKLPHDGKFTTFEGHVPSLMSGTAEEWLRLVKMLVSNIPNTEGLKSDMLVFNHIRMNVKDHDVNFEQPVYHMKTGFLYSKPRQVDCNQMKTGRAVHLSHWKSHQAWEKGLFPVEVGTDGKTPESRHRADAAKVFLNDWREQCGTK